MSNYIVSSGVTRTGLIIADQDKLTVLSGGTIKNTTVDSGGTAYVNRGGVANQTSVTGLGYFCVSSGGFASQTTVIGGNYKHIMVVQKGGTATSTLVTNGGDFEVSGTVYNTTLSGARATKSRDAADLFLFNGAYAEKIFVYSGGVVSAANGSTLDTQIFDGGSFWLSSGCVASNTTINYGGNMNVLNGGTARNTTVNSSGNLNISSGGTAQQLTINKLGSATICSGGTLSDAKIYNGLLSIYGVASGIEVNYGRKYNNIIVYSNGLAKDVTLTHGADARVSSGGIMSGVFCSGYNDQYTKTDLNSLYAENGGKVYDAILKENSELCVSEGGLAQGVSVYAGGGLYVSNNGTTNSVTVNSGGSMYISSGAIHRGLLQIANGAIVTASAGAIIDFTVSEQSNRATALINNWSLINGGNNALYTVTVNANQATGTYKLASCASGFSETITVKNTDDVTLGTLAVGETKTLGSQNYTLAKNAGNLTLTVSKAESAEKKALIVTTALDVVDAYDGVTSLREAIAYAQELGGKQTIKFNISGGDQLILKSQLAITNNICVNAMNQASGEQIFSYGDLWIDGGTLINFNISNSNSLRLSGDIFSRPNSYAENITISEYGDLYMAQSAGKNITLTDQGMLVAYASTLKNVAVGCNSVMCYLADNIFTGTIWVSGAVVAKRGNFKGGEIGATTKSADTEKSQVDKNCLLTFDLSYWTPDCSMVHMANDVETPYSTSASPCTHSMLIDNMKVFTGAGSYTVSVKQNQTLGTYQLAGNAADFQAALSLTIGEITYTNALTVGGKYTVSGKDYALALNDDNVLTLKISKTAISDYNRSGKSDMVQFVNGYVYVTRDLGSGYVQTAAVNYIPPEAWKVAETRRDLTGDGYADIQITSDDGYGSTWVATLRNDYLKTRDITLNYQFIGAYDNTLWSYLGAADFNGDGKSEILMVQTDAGKDQYGHRNVAGWITDSETCEWTDNIWLGALNDGWNIAGTADVTGDGKDNLILRGADGMIGYWAEFGGLPENIVELKNAGNRVLLTTGDFDGDGAADFLWQTIGGSEFSVWSDLGGSFTDTAIGKTGDLGGNWTFAGVGDYNGDGKDEILWCDTTTYKTAYSEGNKANFAKLTVIA